MRNRLWSSVHITRLQLFCVALSSHSVLPPQHKTKNSLSVFVSFFFLSVCVCGSGENDQTKCTVTCGSVFMLACACMCCPVTGTSPRCCHGQQSKERNERRVKPSVDSLWRLPLLPSCFRCLCVACGESCSVVFGPLTRLFPSFNIKRIYLL